MDGGKLSMGRIQEQPTGTTATKTLEHVKWNFNRTLASQVTDKISLTKMPELAVEKVVVHPLVLLSVVDHFNR